MPFFVRLAGCHFGSSCRRSPKRFAIISILFWVVVAMCDSRSPSRRGRDGRPSGNRGHSWHGRAGVSKRHRVSDEDAFKLHGDSRVHLNDLGPTCRSGGRAPPPRCRSPDNHGTRHDNHLLEVQEKIAAMRNLLEFQPIVAEPSQRNPDEVLEEKTVGSISHFKALLALKQGTSEGPMLNGVVKRCIDLGFASAQAFASATEEEFRTAFTGDAGACVDVGRP